MLSNPKCTNQTGINQRQQSTPTEIVSTVGCTLPDSGSRNDSERHDPSSQYTQARYNRHQTPQCSNDSKKGVNEQHNQGNLQTSQELTARPGRDIIDNGSQYQGSVQQHVKPALLSRQSLSEEDINVLLRGLGASEACSIQTVSHSARHSRHNSAFAVDGNDQNEGTHFASFAINGQMTEFEGRLIESPSVDSEARRRHRDESMYADEMDIAAKSYGMDFSRTEDHSSVDESFQHPDRSSLRQQHCSQASVTASSLIKEDSNLTIKASKRNVNIGPSQQGSAIAQFFDIGNESSSSSRAGRALRHSVDLASPSSKGFPDMSDLKAEIPTGRGGYNPAIYSPLANSLPSNMVSLQSSPETPSMTLFEDAEVDSIVNDAQRSFMQATQYNVDFSGSTSPVRHIQHEGAQSIPDLELEDCVRDTGVTTEEIASFIQGPLPEDQKWSCLFEETCGKPCGKRFARKENAKSHVQTHLGDRQFVCRVCQTPFVRQHDLKRHFKIHTVEKAHRCPCGKDFHRHDALTRHRQRGMCVGAFGGTPRKVIKRGRPKKARPSTEERSEKAAKTRQYVMERTRPGSTYASSISGSSEYSVPSPQDFDNLSVTASSPSMSPRAFDDFKLPDMHSQPLTPPASPERISEVLCLPPSAYQTASPEATRQSLSPKLCSIAEISASSALTYSSQEHYQSSPPELDLSSSSPATSQIFDFQAYSEAATSQDQYMKDCDSLRPQIFSQDFQLFSTSNRDPDGVVKFEDFLDFSNVDSTSSDKQILKAHSSMMEMNQQSPYEESANQLDNAFTNF